MSAATLTMPGGRTLEENMRDFDLAILMVDAAVTARAIHPSERQAFTTAVFLAVNLVRIRQGEKEPR